MGSDVPPFSDSTPAPATPPPPASRPRAPLAVVVLAPLAVGYTLWAAQAVLLPILLAMFFALVGNPLVRLLRKAYVPRFIAALAVLSGGLAAAILLTHQMLPPAMEWASKAPREISQFAPKLREFTKPVQEANKAAESIARAAGGEPGRRPQVVHTAQHNPYRMLTQTPRLLVSLLAVVLLTFFFMVYGEKLQRNAIALLPGRQRQKLTVGILQNIERAVSRYVLTITLINATLGLLFAGALVLLGFATAEALLWGTAVALLNFAPYVGPLIGLLAIVLVGIIRFDDPLQALWPAAAYLLLQTLEGQLVTPIVLGRRMALSPLVLILALMLFGWLWGIIGLLLAVPLLVCVKLVVARIEGLEGWARLLE
jgi:predicted PurR-regulated permease PerM